MKTNYQFCAQSSHAPSIGALLLWLCRRISNNPEKGAGIGAPGGAAAGGLIGAAVGAPGYGCRDWRRV